MRSNVLLNCVCVLAWTASVPTEAREIGTLQARREYTSILATPTAPLVETVSTVVCTAMHPKAQIRSFLNNCNNLLITKAAAFKALCDTTDASNAQAIGAQVASDLNAILALMNLGVAQIQKCGIDPSPLRLDLGVSIRDVSQTAFDVVMSFKPVFETVTDLMTRFSVINDSCSSILLQVSTALANVVGACSEQVNMFDVGFFRLVKPQMKIFSEIGVQRIGIPPLLCRLLEVFPLILIKAKHCLDSITTCPAVAEVIWAPLADGPEALKVYLDQASMYFTSKSRKLVGCSYFIQSPSAVARTTLLDPALVASLKLLGDEGLGVEFVVSGNLDRPAPAVLEEILECVAAVRKGQHPERETKFLISEMGKPEMISSHSIVPSSASHSSILSNLFSLSLFSNLTIKLSGLPLLLDRALVAQASAHYDRYKRPYHSTGFAATLQASNEAEPVQEESVQTEVEQTNDRADVDLMWRELKKRMKFYLEPILEAFGDHRIMYSSDFPAFGTLFRTDNDKNESWQTRYYECQFEFYRECLSELGLEDEALDNVFGLNAQKWYGL